MALNEAAGHEQLRKWKYLQQKACLYIGDRLINHSYKLKIANNFGRHLLLSFSGKNTYQQVQLFVSVKIVSLFLYFGR